MKHIYDGFWGRLSSAYSISQSSLITATIIFGLEHGKQ